MMPQIMLIYGSSLILSKENHTEDNRIRLESEWAREQGAISLWIHLGFSNAHNGFRSESFGI